MKLITKFSFLTLTALACSIAYAAPRYTAIDLGIPNDYVTSTNSVGTAVGVDFSLGMSARQAFYYDGTSHRIGTLGGTNSSGTAINRNGHIVGGSDLLGDANTHAFYFDGSMHDLGTLGGKNSGASGINSSNQIVGNSSLAGSDSSHAFLYDGHMHDLGTLGGSNSWAKAISDNGIIIGGSHTTDNKEQHGFMYYDGVMHDLGKNHPYAISSNGLIAGVSELGNLTTHAFLFDGTIQDLGVLGNGRHSSAIAVNNNGWVIGDSNTEPDSGYYYPFLHDGSKMYDLNTLLTGTASTPSINRVLNINDEGTIFAMGHDDHLYALNLVPQVPLPASAWLFGSSFAGLIGLRRKLKTSYLLAAKKGGKIQTSHSF